jgi:hypothetical protein
MKRIACLLVACASLAGCGQSRARICLAEPQARRLNLRFTDALAADSQRNVFLLTGGNVVRYGPREHEIEELLRTSRRDLVDLAVAPGDVLLALGRDALYAVFAGELVELLKLPGQGLKLSCHGDHVYVLVRTRAGRQGLLRYDVARKQIEPLLVTPERVSALCAVPGGCLIAAGGALHKLFVPEASAPGGAREVHRVLLLARAGGAIVSVAADPDHAMVYFSGPRVTYAWAERRAVPLFPMGGQIRYRRGVLAIASPALRQVVQLSEPAAQADRMLRDAPPAVLPPS